MQTPSQPQYRAYAQFNQFTVTGRIQYAEIVKGSRGDFLSVTVITNFLNDDDGYTARFIDSGNLMSLFEQGYLPVGRQVTLTGHVDSFTELYKDKQTGEFRHLKRPQMQLSGVSIPTGGLGPMPKSASVVRPSDANKQRATYVPAVDEVPVF